MRWRSPASRSRGAIIPDSAPLVAATRGRDAVREASTGPRTMSDHETTALEAAAFRRLLRHCCTTPRRAEHRPDDSRRLLPQLPRRLVPRSRRGARHRDDQGRGARSGLRRTVRAVEGEAPARCDAGTTGRVRRGATRQKLTRRIQGRGGVPAGHRGIVEPTTQFTQHCVGAGFAGVATDAAGAGRNPVGAGVPAGQRGTPEPTTQLTQHCCCEGCCIDCGAIEGAIGIGGASCASCCAGLSCSSTAQSWRLALQAVRVHPANTPDRTGSARQLGELAARRKPQQAHGHAVQARCRRWCRRCGRGRDRRRRRCRNAC